MTIKETKENSEDMNLEIGLTTEEVEKRLARYGYN